MKANYHTHTWRCGHATGSEREYVERAIEGGLKVLGFSDHTPYPYPEGYTSGMRMRVDQLEDYVTTVLSLKEEYKKDIEIHVGLEVEYYPAFFDGLLQAVASWPIEYFLLAQHCVGNEMEGVYSGTLTQEPSILERYCDQVIEGMETGRFTYVAHPDILNFNGDIDFYVRQAKRLCRRAREMEVPLEINFLGLYEKRHYPRKEFWEAAGKEGCAVVFGADAHMPEAIWRPEVYEQALEMVDKYGLNLQETVAFRNPLTGKRWGD